ncbi:MAG: DUF4179 domain-containing protein [Anaerolineales bacterium]
MNDKDNRVKDALESIALRNVPNDTNLWPRIAFQLGERSSLMQTLRARPVLLALVLFLLLVFLSGAAYAIGRSLGYVPGVGLVEEGSGIRVLAEPVSVERNGLTVTVEQVVADATRTIVAYQIDGILPVASGFPMCSKPPVLRSLDKNELRFLSGGGGGMESINGEPMKYETSYVFPSLPTGTDRISIVFPCILPEAGNGTAEWEIPLLLGPAPAGYMTPAVEIGATYVSSGPSYKTISTPTFEVSTPFVYDESFPPTPTPVPNGSGLYLDKVIELADAYILVGNFTDAGDLPGALDTSGSSVYFYRPYIEDGNGKLARFQPRIDIRPDIEWSRVNYWAYEIPKPVLGPLKIRLDQVDISTMSTVRFQFDTGPDPQPGQEWSLDLPLRLGEYDIVIDSVKIMQDGYRFKLHTGFGIPKAFELNFVDNLSMPGTIYEFHSSDKVDYIYNITFLSPLPTGQLTVELMMYQTLPLHGPWVLEWIPPTP